MAQRLHSQGVVGFGSRVHALKQPLHHRHHLHSYCAPGSLTSKWTFFCKCLSLSGLPLPNSSILTPKQLAEEEVGAIWGVWGSGSLGLHMPGRWLLAPLQGGVALC